MAKIKVNDLKPTGSELFNDSESFLNDLSGDELEQALGGLALVPSRIIISCFCTPNTIGTIIITKSPVIL